MNISHFSRLASVKAKKNTHTKWLAKNKWRGYFGQNRIKQKQTIYFVLNFFCSHSFCRSVNRLLNVAEVIVSPVLFQSFDRKQNDLCAPGLGQFFFFRVASEMCTILCIKNPMSIANGLQQLTRFQGKKNQTEVGNEGNATHLLKHTQANTKQQQHQQQKRWEKQSVCIWSQQQHQQKYFY